MKAMLSAFVMMALIAFGAYYVLNEAGFGSDERQSSASVRID